MKKTILGLILFLISVSSNAQGNSKWGKITDLYFGSAGNYLQVTMDVSDSSSFCGQPNRPYYLEYDTSSDQTKEFYKTRVSVLLAAFMAGKKVRFYLVNNQCASEARPKIQGVQVSNQ